MLSILLSQIIHTDIDVINSDIGVDVSDIHVFVLPIPAVDIAY